MYDNACGMMGYSNQELNLERGIMMIKGLNLIMNFTSCSGNLYYVRVEKL